METVVNKKLYEALFLVSSVQAAADWDGINTAIKTILERSDAEIVSLKKWDERRLAYDIGKNSRGTYMLCYFKADGEKISNIERDARLSESIIRVLILSTEVMSENDIGKDTPAGVVEKQRQKREAQKAEQLEQAKQQEQSQKAEEAKPLPVDKQPEQPQKVEEAEQLPEAQQPEQPQEAEEVKPLPEDKVADADEGAEQTEQPDQAQVEKEAGE